MQDMWSPYFGILFYTFQIIDPNYAKNIHFAHTSSQAYDLMNLIYIQIINMLYVVLFWILKKCFTLKYSFTLHSVVVSYCRGYVHFKSKLNGIFNSSKLSGKSIQIAAVAMIKNVNCGVVAMI